MDITNIIKKIEINLHPFIESVENIRDNRMLVRINPEELIPVAKILLFKLDLRFVIASAYQTKYGFEILYHFSYDAVGLILHVQLNLPSENPEVESLYPILVGANWIEREIHELYGVKFLNHPDLKKLVSEGNWAEGVFPYRQEFAKDKNENPDLTS